MAHLFSKTVLMLFAAASLGFGAAAASGAATQYVPLPTYRVGPYASSGTLWWAGERDYFRYINDVQGGIDGIKIDYEEFETEWSPDRTVEVYERVKNGKNGSPLAFFFTHGTPATYALIERAAADRIPLIDPAGGRTESTDGTVFPYAFPLLFNYYSQASVGINYIAQREGGFDKLKGKKIVTVYHDSAYGRETQPAIALLAQKYGFENIQIPVADPGNEQSAQWRRVREIKPDWVFLRTWGVSTPVALKTAARFGIPADHIIGDVWAGSEADVIPAGDAARGYQALAPYPGGADFEIHKQLRKYILDTGKSDLRDPKFFGSVYYNIGLVNAALAVEALRTGYRKFGAHPLNGEQGRWAFEHLVIDDARLKQIGFYGLLQPIRITPTDHEGGGAARIEQWDGQKWVVKTGWISADHALLQPLIESKANAYAKEKGITRRDPSKDN
ncbi:ABC transporter substrate-binding protein [Paraburkholderia kururiensis]|uniref:ABC transporter substrate-binding protein n=1 Tax=Paraburkholderia kururiensis TaxID=984307 RepID=A0ABZ0WM96_9BURK|nr:ABC transporter substrate-binding protein [Paraburkholderia kururiensis]WQD78391.1 ABC transporter substrate-binding protein [Paraburkholderia kururiensis]